MADVKLVETRSQGLGQWQPVTAIEPQAQQVALALGLVPVLESGAVVQNLVIVDELDVTRLEFHHQVNGGIVGQRIEEVEGFDLLLGQGRHVVDAGRS